jgi:small multidrug resistance family-3 protein
MRFALFFAAAILEIAGCFLVWQAWRQGPVWLWAPALVALGAFAWLLALSGMDSAGRTFAIYGGIYVLASVAFMVWVEGVRPDRWDLAGIMLTLAGAAVIFFAPRG